MARLITTTRASQIALIAIPVAIGVNILMLVTRMTRVVNVDIWNIWHMTFTGAMLHLATGSYWLGILGVVVHAAFVYKLGDWFAKTRATFWHGRHCHSTRFLGIPAR